MLESRDCVMVRVVCHGAFSFGRSAPGMGVLNVFYIHTFESRFMPTALDHLWSDQLYSNNRLQCVITRDVGAWRVYKTIEKNITSDRRLPCSRRTKVTSLSSACDKAHFVRAFL